LVVLVGVRMQLLGEPAEGAFDRRRARILLHPQDVVGVAHPDHSRKAAAAPSTAPLQPQNRPFMWYRFGQAAMILAAKPMAHAPERVQGRRLLTSQAPCLAPALPRQAWPCSQRSGPWRWT